MFFDTNAVDQLASFRNFNLDYEYVARWKFYKAREDRYYFK